MTCDKVDAKVRVNEDVLEILDILGENEQLTKEKSLRIIVSKKCEEIKDVKLFYTKQKVQVDLEVDTSIKDLVVNPYAKMIHMQESRRKRIFQDCS